MHYSIKKYLPDAEVQSIKCGFEMVASEDLHTLKGLLSMEQHKETEKILSQLNKKYERCTVQMYPKKISILQQYIIHVGLLWIKTNNSI